MAKRKAAPREEEAAGTVEGDGAAPKDAKEPEAGAAKQEIDAIFAKRRKLPVPAQQKRSPGVGTVRRAGKTAAEVHVVAKESAKGGPKKKRAAGTQRRTADGFKVYKEEELGWNKREAGGTALCPFDCDCCF